MYSQSVVSLIQCSAHHPGGWDHCLVQRRRRKRPAHLCIWWEKEHNNDPIYLHICQSMDYQVVNITVLIDYAWDLEMKVWVTMYVPVAENPSCRQATCASTVPQKSSHTVPHCPFRQTSTRPSLSVVPPTNRMPPAGQAVKWNSISSACNRVRMMILY